MMNHDDLDFYEKLEIDHRSQTKTPSFFQLMIDFPDAKDYCRKKYSKEMKIFEDKKIIAKLERDDLALPSIIEILSVLTSRMAILSVGTPLTNIKEQNIENARGVCISQILKVGNGNKISCIYHNEKTASMHIYKNKFYCFGCNKRGDVIDIAMQMYQIPFKEAVEKLSTGG